MRFKNRYQAMKNRQANDWWTITFGDPVSWVVLGVIGDIKWITPIGITWLSFFSKIVPVCLMITNDRALIITAAILLQIGQVLDSMDGNLARYRNQTTLRGGFLDRILDGTGFIFVMAGVSWLTYQNGDEPYYLLLGPMTSAFYLVICYVYWTTAYQEQKYIGKTNKINPGGNVRSIDHISTWKYILIGQKKLFSIHQADFYFWVGLGLILEISEFIIWLLFIVLFIRVLNRIKSRYFYLKLLDKDHSK
jgi:phosphatidylglycerophosphate synthase